jgi:Protein of unknown function (DUF2795)
MPLKVKDRTYNSDDLRNLMYAVAGWAQGWDDVLWYLETVAPHDHDLFRRERVQAMVWDVEHLKRTGARFTTDYREVYKEITCLECGACLPPRAVPTPALHLRHLADKWLEGLRFPATGEEALERAKHNHAPEEVLSALRQLRAPSYPSVGALVQEVRVQA